MARSACSGALRHLLIVLIAAFWASQAVAGEPAREITLDDPVPWGQQPVDYHSTETTDAVARLKARLTSGDARLAFNGPQGYLASLLKHLDVPVESQLLVYSKTALNPRLVGPANPRAVYFNDHASVAWTPGAASLEITALDAVKGAVFYSLPQDSTAEPRLERETRCLACHAGSSALNVPGWLLRSFVTDDSGNPLDGYSRVTGDMPIARRFGGWYVTGRSGRNAHRGRALPADAGESRHLTTRSDFVAHLVLSHQVHTLNLMIRAGQEARLGLRSDAEEQLLRQLLFADEAPLAGPVEGDSGYRGWFEEQGPRDAAGRSLRQFDLRSRLFRYRLSYLIYSPCFDGLPAAVSERLYRRLLEVLATPQPAAPFDHLPADERAAIIEIVRQTKPKVPEAWKLAENPRSNSALPERQHR